MNDVLEHNEKSLPFLENQLLYSSRIKPSSNYSGVLYFPVDNNYPDYRVVYKDTINENLNFYYNRSDRAEVLNPWLD
ncbi:MAG: hypothetical protein JJE21_05245 [Spirochaetaceae bacterium]|nr:hypothetical protein [Spirochaetaceae bacterium]